MTRLYVRRTTISTTSPIVTGHGPITSRDAVLVGIGEPPHTGWSELAPLPGFGPPVDAAAVARDMETNGTDTTNPTGRQLIESASADHTARQRGVPLAVHLAREYGFDLPTMVVGLNATIGDGEPGDVARAAHSHVADGFRTIKLKVAAGSLDRDVRRVDAVRSAIGPDIALRLDANQGWTFKTALIALELLATYELDYVEEPTAEMNDIEQLATIGVPIALDESLMANDPVATAIASPASVLVIKPSAMGVAAAMEITAQAARRSKRVVVTSFFDGPVGLATAAHVAAACGAPGPHGLATAHSVDAEFPDWLRPARGQTHVSDAPGIGIDWS